MSNQGKEGSAPMTCSVADPFEKILLGTIELHRLDWAGKNDSEEADAIRDTMDDPWHMLTDSQQNTARLVSAALYDATKAFRLTKEEREAIGVGIQACEDIAYGSSFDQMAADTMRAAIARHE